MKKNNLFTAYAIVFCLFVVSVSRAQLVPSFVNNAFATGNDCYTITNNAMSNSGAAWYNNPIDLTSDFDIVFNAYFGANSNGADGMAFVLKTTPDPVIGIIGGGLGYRDLPDSPSLAVEFDTYRNTTAGSGLVINDPLYNHVALQKNGNVSHVSPDNLVAPVQASPTSSNIKDNNEHQVKIQWRADTQTFTVIFDCSERFSYTSDIINTVFEGESTVYFGFTGSTGSLSNLQYICFQYLSFLETGLEDQSICLGDSVNTIDGTYAGAVNYQWSPATGVSDTAIPNPVFSPDVTTTYTLTITDNCGQTLDEDVTITVNDPVAAAVAAVTPICSGENAVFNFNGTPGAQVTYTLNSGVEQTILLDETGAASITIAATTDQEVSLVKVGLTTAPFCETILTGSALVAVTVTDASFSMTADCEGATASITGETGGTFAFNPAVTDGALLDAATGTITNGVPGATYFVEYTVNVTCPASQIEQVTLLPAVTYASPVDLVLCDGTENDGFAEFDLSAAATQIADGNTDVTVSFYENEAEAETGTAGTEVALTFTNTVPDAQTLWVRVEDNSIGCYAVTDIDVQVNPLPVVAQPDALTSCDDDGNGSAGFDLDLAADAVLTDNPNLTVTFYTSQTEAENGIPATQLASPYEAQGSQVWIRAENPSTGCYTTVSLQLIVAASPVINTPDTIDECDSDNDGFMTFDLTVVEGEVTGNDQNISLTYAYDDNGTLVEISTPSAFENTVADKQTIWIIAENGSGCTSSVSFDLIVNKCFIQRGISPNGDNRNDSFDLTGFGIKEINVFNRYGAKVYSASNYTNGWHGQSEDGSDLPTGTYYYSIYFAEKNGTYGEQMTGWIYVNRQVN